MCIDSARQWLDAVWDVAGITPSDILGPSRVRVLSFWRQLLAALMWDDGMSRGEIGAALGRNRRTAYYMIDRGQHLIRYSPGAASWAADLREAATQRAA